MHDNVVGVVVSIIVILFVYKLLLKPLNKFSETVPDESDVEREDSFRRVTEIYGLDGTSGVSLTQKYASTNKRKRCEPDGLYLGRERVPADCAALCGSPDYAYKFVNSEDSMIVNYKFLSKIGGYCLPKNTLHCNTYTSKLIKTLDDWKCLPKGKLFGGEDGCSIVGCNGFLKDNLTGEYYEGRVPMTLAVSDPDTEFVSHQHAYGVPGPSVYRFQCTDTEIDPDTREPTALAKKCTVKDFMNNKLIESEYSRFDRIRNVCASLIYNASSVIEPNFENGTCACLAKFHSPRNGDGYGNPAIVGRRTVENVEVIDIAKRCSPCLDGWSEKDNYTNVGIPCKKSFDDSPAVDVGKITIPCGARGFDNTTAACINVKLYVSRGLSSFARKLFAEKTEYDKNYNE